MSSPAERYAAARRRQAASRSELARFMAGYDFPFDDFQVRGCEALERGEGVLVAATAQRQPLSIVLPFIRPRRLRATRISGRRKAAPKTRTRRR